MSGWVKLHRKVIDNEIFRHDLTAWHVFETLLLLADSKTGKWSGGMFQLAEQCGMNRNTLYKAIIRLELTEMVNRSVNSKYTVYNICKWSDYQSDSKHLGKQPVNSQQTASNTLTRNRSRNKNIVSKDTSVVSKLYYEYLKKYRIPVTNHNTLRLKIKELEDTNGSEWSVRYLTFMLEQYEGLDIKYKPEINDALDLFKKSKSIEEKLKKLKQSEEIY